MADLLWEGILDLHREPNIFYLVDASNSFVTDISLRSKISTPLYLKKHLPNESGLSWLIFRDKFEFALTDLNGDRFYTKASLKSREIIPAYNFEQLSSFVRVNYPKMIVFERKEGDEYIFEVSQLYEDKFKKSWYIDDDGMVRAQGRSIFKAQAFHNAFDEYISKVRKIKIDLERFF